MSRHPRTTDEPCPTEPIKANMSEVQHNWVRTGNPPVPRRRTETFRSFPWLPAWRGAVLAFLMVVAAANTVTATCLVVALQKSNRAEAEMRNNLGETMKWVDATLERGAR